MAIRFQCSSCLQPIEVDDEWASKVVACPYCRNTVTAPAESSLGDLAGVPTASPAQPPSTPGDVSPPPPITSRGNRLAIVTWVLLALSIATMMAVNAVVRQHAAELEPVQKSLEAGKDPFQISREHPELFGGGGNVPPWMLASSMLMVMGGLFWLAAVVCGIVAVTRPYRRAMAISALVTAAVLPVFMCCGGLLGTS